MLCGIADGLFSVTCIDNRHRYLHNEGKFVPRNFLAPTVKKKREREPGTTSSKVWAANHSDDVSLLMYRW